MSSDNHRTFFAYYHHLINLRLYTSDQIEQRNQTILVANWKRAELRLAKEKEDADARSP